MGQPLRPFGTACWLTCHTVLTDRQIARYTGLPEEAVRGIRQDGPPPGTVGLDPVAIGILTLAEIDRCAADPAADLRPAESGSQHMPGAARAV